MGTEVRVTTLPALLAAALAVCGCAGGGTTAERGSSGNTFVAADGQTVRCVDEAVTGSRVPQRICRTEAMWRQLEEQGQGRTRDLQGPIYGPRDVAAPGTPPL